MVSVVIAAVVVRLFMELHALLVTQELHPFYGWNNRWIWLDRP